MAPKRLKNLKTNMPRAKPNVLGISNTKVDVANIASIRKENAEMVSRNKTARRLTRNYPNES